MKTQGIWMVVGACALAVGCSGSGSSSSSTASVAASAASSASTSTGASGASTGKSSVTSNGPGGVNGSTNGGSTNGGSTTASALSASGATNGSTAGTSTTNGSTTGSTGNAAGTTGTLLTTGATGSTGSALPGGYTVACGGANGAINFVSVSPTAVNFLATWTPPVQMVTNLYFTGAGFSPDGKTFYISNIFADGGPYVGALNPVTGVMTEVALGADVAVSPSGEVAYVADGGITALNPSTGKSAFVAATSAKFGADTNLYGLQWAGSSDAFSYIFEPAGSIAFLALQNDPLGAGGPVTVIPPNYGKGGTNSTYDNNAPVAWSGTGSMVAFFGQATGQYEALVTSTITSGTPSTPATLISGAPSFGNFMALSPDGQTLAYANQGNLYVISPTAAAQPLSALSQGIAVETDFGMSMAFTADSKYLVVANNTSTSSQIGLIPVSAGAATGQPNFMSNPNVGPPMIVSPVVPH